MDSNGTILSSIPDEGPSESSCQELFVRDALGTVVNELFVDFASLFGISNNCNPKNFNLFSVFVKDSGNHFSYVGHLGPNGGVLRDAEITTSLRPHLHRSIKQHIDQYLTANKYPFTRNIAELTAEKLTQRPEGKHFSWIDMGMSQIHYVDREKLAAKLQQCAVDLKRSCLRNAAGYLYILHKNCISERLHYYSSKLYQCSSWMGKDHAAIEAQIKHVTKCEPCIRYDDNDAPRAFSLCKVAMSKDGRLGNPDYHVTLIPTNPYEQSGDLCSFIVEELDFGFVSAVISNLKAMKTREIIHSALQDIYVLLESHERPEVLRFLQRVIRKFQTEEKQVIQMVDMSFAVTSIPACLDAYPTILSRMLRAAGIVVTEASSQDSDEEDKAESQIVFQPAICQEYLRLVEFLLTLLVEGSITDKQCETAAQLLDTEVTSLQELFYTQMCSIGAPWKLLNPKEEPMVSLWKKGTRTKQFLESLGLRDDVRDDLRVVLCPENCLLLNVLSVFFKDVD